MKKIIIIMIIIVVAIFLFATRRTDSPDKTRTSTVNNSENDNFRPDPSNATFIFDDGSITLSAGQNEKNLAPENTLAEETVLLDKFAYGDLNADGKTDTALLLARYGGGSGIFVYLGAYVSGPVNYHGSKTAFVGDRISPQSITIDQGIVTVNYLDHKLEEALVTEPTIPISKQFIYKNGEFQEK